MAITKPVSKKDVEVSIIWNGVESVKFYNFDPEGTRPQRRKFYKERAYELLVWEITNNPNYLKKFIRLEMNGEEY